MQTTDARLSLRERLVPYRGTWNLAWVAERYLRCALGSLTIGKALNAVQAMAEMKLGRRRVGSRPFVLRIEPCNVCNLRCPQCACGAQTDPRPKGFMALEDFQRVLDENRGAAMLLRLDGMGEPSLHPKLLDMIRMAKSYGLSVSISSNLCTPAWDDPMPWLECGLDRLVVPIDGTSQESFGRYRIRGDYHKVVERLQRLTKARIASRARRLRVVVQFIDFGYNHDEIPRMRQLVREWRADRFELVSPQDAMRCTRVDPLRPHRCFWLWSVLTVDWNLNYHACTNSWSLPWPRLNLRDIPSAEFWNHRLMQEARQYNLDRSSAVIANDPGCKCHRCVDMLSAPLVGDYLCE